MFRTIYPARHMVVMRRYTERLLEGACKVTEAEIDEFGQIGQRNIVSEMLFYEFRDTFLLARGQAASKHWFGFRSFQSGQFVHQHEAQNPRHTGSLKGSEFPTSDLSLSAVSQTA